MKNSKSYFYSLIIFILLFYSSCSSSSFESIKKKDHFSIKHFAGAFFIDYDFITAVDYNGKDFYILTKILKDSLISAEFEKIKRDSVYKLDLEKIDSVVVLEIPAWKDDSMYLDEILIWSKDTVRVPLYSAKNIVSTGLDVYVRKVK